MNKYSPAPWIEYEDDDGNVIVKMDESHDVLIANLEGSCGTCHANARLIQLSPELLELLEKLVSYWDSGAANFNTNQVEFSFEIASEIDHYHAQARMLISKAKGE